MVQSNKHLLGLVAIPSFICIPYYRNRSSVVSDIWEVMTHGDLKGIMATLDAICYTTDTQCISVCFYSKMHHIFEMGCVFNDTL